MNEVEIATISRKYETFRLQDPRREKLLRDSIMEYGIREPLQCVGAPEERYILLDGFKRLRCACRLRMSMVPVELLGSDESASILQLVRLSVDRSLSAVEQACFVDELHSRWGMSRGAIASALDRSHAWVSVRLGLVDEMSEDVRDAIFSGRFPLRCFMYTLRQVTRVHGISREQTDRFVRAVSGQGLSTRDIDTLAAGYFRGGAHLKRQIEEGNLRWTLQKLRGADPEAGRREAGLSEAEASVLQDLDLAQKYLHRLQGGLARMDLGSPVFIHRVRLFGTGLEDALQAVMPQIRRMYEIKIDQRNGTGAL